MHYDLEIVKEEIFNYCRGRWVALQGRSFVRYDAKGEPLSFKEINDIPKSVKIYGARTIYSTAAIYEDLKNLKIKKYTPFIDIDATYDDWGYAIDAAKIIVEALNREGLKESIYLLWSGEGIHVRINENAIPSNLDQFYAAKAVVNYILKKTKDEIIKLAEKSRGILKVENLIDEKRVFTSPLSLHRTKDAVAVCFLPKDLDNFKIEWTNPSNFKHDSSWKNYVLNEAEQLCKLAIKELGIKFPSISSNTVQDYPKGKIGRFQIMGLLQAARYYVLFNDLDKAKSFGINRAIFYAWAKHYGRYYTGRKTSGLKKEEIQAKVQNKKEIAGEEVFFDEKSGYFIVGQKPNLPKDYDSEIRSRINSIYPYDEIWNAAIEYISSFPKEILMDQRKFFEKVYLPVRDNFEAIVNKFKKKDERSSIS